MSIYGIYGSPQIKMLATIGGFNEVEPSRSLPTLNSIVTPIFRPLRFNADTYHCCWSIPRSGLPFATFLYSTAVEHTRAGLALFCFGHSRRYKPDVGNQRERNVLGER